MSDLLKLILANGAIGTIAVGLLAFLMKRWVSEAVSHHFRKVLEHEKVSLEKGFHVLERRGFIYPEMLEVVYRMRNDLRDLLEVVPTRDEFIESLVQVKEERTWLSEEAEERISRPVELLDAFSRETMVLTENLYRYRAFIDEETFDMLHRYKVCAHRALINLDSLRRPQAERARRSVRDLNDEELMEQARSFCHEINSYYPLITERIKKQIEGTLAREAW